MSGWRWSSDSSLQELRFACDLRGIPWAFTEGADDLRALLRRWEQRP